MGETTRIAEQLERTFAGDAWHGPSVKAVLDGVDAGTAAARPIPGAHTIAELVGHVTIWTDVVRRRLAGEDVQVPASEDFPAAGSESAWAARLARLDEVQRGLAAAVTALPD